MHCSQVWAEAFFFTGDLEQLFEQFLLALESNNLSLVLLLTGGRLDAGNISGSPILARLGLLQLLFEVVTLLLNLFEPVSSPLVDGCLRSWRPLRWAGLLLAGSCSFGSCLALLRVAVQRRLAWPRQLANVAIGVALKDEMGVVLC